MEEREREILHDEWRAVAGRMKNIRGIPPLGSEELFPSVCFTRDKSLALFFLLFVVGRSWPLGMRSQKRDRRGHTVTPTAHPKCPPKGLLND